MRRYRPFRWGRWLLLALEVAILAYAVAGLFEGGSSLAWVVAGLAALGVALWVFSTVVQVRLIRQQSEFHG